MCPHLITFKIECFLLRPLWAHFQRFLLDGGHTLHSTGAWVWPGADLRIQDLCRPDRTFFCESTSSYNWLENQFCIHRGFSCFWCWSAIDRFWAAFVEIDAGTGTQNFLTRSTRSISFPFPPLCQKFLNLQMLFFVVGSIQRETWNLKKWKRLESVISELYLVMIILNTKHYLFLLKTLTFCWKKKNMS